MSPTLLEVAMVLILAGVGWQLGVALLPAVGRFWRESQQRLEEAECAEAHPPPPQFTTNAEVGVTRVEAAPAQNDRHLAEHTAKETNNIRLPRPGFAPSKIA